MRDFQQQQPANPAAWLEGRWKPLKDSVYDVFRDMYAEAGWMGVATARALAATARERAKAAGDVSGQVDWDDWTPGDPKLAQLLLGDNLSRLLYNSEVVIKGIEGTRLQDLGNVLAFSAGQGLSMEATADLIQERFLTNDSWADMVARTEIRRASTDAALTYYTDSGIEQKEWLVAWDEACEICAEAQAMGPIPLNDDFGDAGMGPPGHPNCLCVILPVVPDGETPAVEDLGEGDVDVAGEPVVEDEPEASVVQVPSVMRGDKTANVTKAPRAAIANALAMLANLPVADVDDEDREFIHVPWPIQRRPELDPDLWVDSSVQDVAIADLVATQPFLYRERVADFIRNPGAIEGQRRALANVYDAEQMLIVDGHHRLAAWWLLGADRANVWYLES